MIKTILLISSTIFSAISSLSTGYTVSDYYLSSYKEPNVLAKSIEYVETPKGSKVEVSRENEQLSLQKIEELNNKYDSPYPNAVRLSSATSIYNCHSYAWYRQSETNPYWMNDPSLYWEDESYIESKGGIGDILVYKQGNSVIHSAVIERRINVYESSLDDLDNLQVTSKWGQVGLYSHRASDSPYTKDTTSIKYYSLKNHNHIFTSYHWLNYKQHEAVCSCGQTIKQGHIVAPGSFGNGQRYAICLNCGGQAEMGLIIGGKSKINSMFELIDGYYYVKESMMIENILNLSYKEYQIYVKKNL